MKQKVTIKVGMECEICRNKALKIASMIKGVSAVAIEGDSKDRVVVTGDDVDMVCLGRNLRKKFRIVTVLTVEEVKPPKPPKPPEPPKQKPDKEKPKVVTVCVVPCCKCQSNKCEGKCEKRDTCGSQNCEDGCKACSRCGSYRCPGDCAAPVICYGQCPPWISCPSCCSYKVVYQQDADPCSIM